MTGNFAISLVGTPAEVGRLQICAPAAVSATGRSCRTRQIRGKLRSNEGYQANPGFDVSPLGILYVVPQQNLQSFSTPQI